MLRALFLLNLILVMPGFLFSQINNPKNIPFEWDTDTLNTLISLDELTMVLPRGSFSIIDYPSFIDKQEALNSFFEHEPVISIEINGRAKAYPLNMLTMHEMTNDTIGGMHILPTYCPLCNSSLVFNRKVKTVNGNEKILEFEVSGMLRFSDMVMADRESSTLWQQLTGFGIVGENAGIQLEILPSQVISVLEFFKRYPNGKILSPNTNTKAEEHYGNNPYVGYDALDGKPWEKFFDNSTLDKRLPAMERIISISSISGNKIYPFSILQEEKIISDHFDGTDLVIFYKEGTVSILDQKDISKSRSVGSATVFSSVVDGTKHTFLHKGENFVDKQTNSIWDITGKCIMGPQKGKSLEKIVYSSHFAFAWLNFHPESEIYGFK